MTARLNSKSSLYTIITLLIIQSYGTCQELYGVSVFWRPTSHTSFAFSFRLIWEGLDSVGSMRQSCKTLSSSLRATCEEVIDKKFQAGLLQIRDQKIKTYIFQNYTWMCFHGCQGKMLSQLNELFFTDSTSFYETKWESGVGTVDIQLTDQDDQENIRFGFFYPNGSLVSGLGEAHLSMAVRNDTKRPNISPLVNVFPVYRVPSGCNITIRLFPFDGDGDKVKCHWETLPMKNSPQSHATLNLERCEVIFSTTSSQINVGDVIYLSLYAEDYSDIPVKFVGYSRYISAGPFCRTPIKLRVTIGNAVPCHIDGPVFDKELTLPPYYKRSYEVAYLANKNDKLLPFGTDNKNDKILTSGPRYMIFTTIRNGTLITEGAWKDIDDLGMKGIHQACGMAYSDQGIPGESRCAVLLIFEPDECNSTINPCGKGDFTCSYPAIKVTENQSMNGDCSAGMSVGTGNYNTLIKIGLPVGLSLLLLLIIIITMCVLSHYWKKKVNNEAYNGDTKLQEVTKKSLDF